MTVNKQVFTKQAVSCLNYASTLAYTNNQKTIHGDDLFWGIYNFIRNKEFFDIFCNVTGLHDTEALDIYYKNHYNVDFLYHQFSDKKLPLNKKLQKSLQDIATNTSQETDFIFLFFISYFDLSSQCYNYLLEHNMDPNTLTENCEKLLLNPLIPKIWLFAFLKILNKLFNNMHLDAKNIKIMKIENIDNMEHLESMVNAVDSEIKERDDDDHRKWSTKTKTKKNEKKKMTIEYFGTDLTREHKDGFIDPIIWRNKEIDQMIYTLLRKNKNNPLLIGEAGVGKTAVVEWLAQRIAQNQVPEKLKNKKIFMLDMWSLVAGTKYRWEFEARLKSILEEAMDITNNIILFIDEIHSIIGTGGQENNDAAQMIKPLLARWKIKLIWATTFNEYQKYFEKDAALKRRFQELIIDEPNTETAKLILMWLKETYENFHGVHITEEAIIKAIKLSQRYMLNKHLPDKAIDIIDEACARKSTINQKLETDTDYKKNEEKIKKIEKQIETAIEKQDYFTAAELKEQEEKLKTQMQKIRTNKNVPMHLRPTINEPDIGLVLAEKTGIPANVVNESEIEKLKRLNEDLSNKIMGQENAVSVIVKTITRNRLSVIEKNKPIWSFLFLGPTGVGKTYLAKLIAKDYFGDDKSLIRIDMSEFMEKHSVSKLVGAPAGYVGYDEGWNLTESVKRKPYSVILFDEIEKASPEVLNILLQILDEWHLKDSKWKLIDFKSTIIIMTSNIWSEEFSTKQTTIWFKTGESKTQVEKEFKIIKERINNQVKDFLSPELLNRIDHKIIFKPLSKKILQKIFKKDIEEFLQTRKNNSDIKLPKFSEAKIQSIIDKIYEPQYGARPLARYIQDEIEPKIINSIINPK